jgi:FKBP-type peptidyl-prolyl cis-trans isomerase FkpA
LPKSRKRKSKGRGSSSRSTYTTKSSPRNLTKMVVIISICALLVVGAVFIFTRDSGKTSSSSNSSSALPTFDGEVKTASGLKYVDEVVGTGDSPKAGQTVTVHYTGTFLNGTKFDSSFDRGQPTDFKIGVGKVIAAWDEGLMSMKVGGKRKLIVPSNLGYGAAGFQGMIPPNTPLIFDIQLLGIK